MERQCKSLRDTADIQIRSVRRCTPNAEYCYRRAIPQLPPWMGYFDSQADILLQGYETQRVSRRVVSRMQFRRCGEVA